MPEQELTLFGGWAKALTPQPIDSGLFVHSGTVSVSIYTESTEMYHPSFNTNQSDIVYLLNEYCYKPRVDLALFQFNVNEHQFVWVDEQSETSISRVVRWWLDRAFLRFFEIWGKGTSDTLMRGLSGTSKLRRSFAGRCGCQSIGRRRGDVPPITRLDNKVWISNNIPTLYPSIRRLPHSGIKSAQVLAKQLRDKKKKGLLN